MKEVGELKQMSTFFFASIPPFSILIRMEIKKKYIVLRKVFSSHVISFDGIVQKIFEKKIQSKSQLFLARLAF